MTNALEALRRLGGARPKDLTQQERRIADAEALLAELQRDRGAAAQKVADLEARVGAASKAADAREGLSALGEALWHLEVLEGALRAKLDALAALRASAEESAEQQLARERRAVLDAIDAEAETYRRLARELVTGELIPRAEKVLGLARRYREMGGEALPFETYPPRALAREVLGELVQALSPGAELFGWDTGAAQEAARRFRGLP